MSAVDHVVVVLTHTSCASCGITFGIPRDMAQQRRNDHKEFYCPNGHKLWFAGKSEAEKLKGELDYVQQSRDKWARYYETEKRTSAAYRGQITKMKKRMKAGVCPCCHRTFKQLAAHMKTQHPNFAKAVVP